MECCKQARAMPLSLFRERSSPLPRARPNILEIPPAERVATTMMGTTHAADAANISCVNTLVRPAAPAEARKGTGDCHSFSLFNTSMATESAGKHNCETVYATKYESRHLLRLPST